MMSYKPFLVGQMLDLRQCVLLKSGRTRNIHAHENLPGVLIKTLQPDLVDGTGHFKAYPWWKQWRSHGAYFAFHRELAEFMVLCRRGYGRDSSGLPLARIHGLVLTSAGLGLVVERISGGDGGLAPTMLELLTEGRFNENHLRALQSFFDRCRDMHVVFGDLTVDNIVYTEVRDPRGEFICIDGFGEKAAVPIHRWNKVLNDRKVERVRKRVLAAVPKKTLGLRPATALP